ncbi:MAG: ABC transporter substrate-binding protein, partial [Dehalococcoidia bacterium]
MSAATRMRGLALGLLVLVLASIGVAACGDSDNASGTQPITFMAGFRPQANLPFVAVYVAQERGLFADEGLEVDIQHASG